MGWEGSGYKGKVHSQWNSYTDARQYIGCCKNINKNKLKNLQILQKYLLIIFFFSTASTPK